MYFFKQRRIKVYRPYTHTYPRTLTVQIRRYNAVSYLRSVYRLSINRLVSIIGGSSRTIKRDIDSMVKRFDCLRRSKNSTGIVNQNNGSLSWNALKTRIRKYILGQIGSIYDAVGDDPP